MPLYVIIGVGFVFTVTDVGVLVPVQLPCVTLTLYDPCVFTVILCVVAPVDHR